MVFLVGFTDLKFGFAIRDVFVSIALVLWGVIGNPPFATDVIESLNVLGI